MHYITTLPVLVRLSECYRMTSCSRNAAGFITSDDER